MPIHVALRHVTRYTYDRLITMGPHVVRLRPAPHCRTPILSYSLKITPDPHFINWQQDPQANYLARLVFTEKTKEFSVEVNLVAEMAVYSPFDFFLEPEAEYFPFKYDPSLKHELEPYRRTNPVTPKLNEYYQTITRELFRPAGDTPPSPLPPTRTIDFLVHMNQQLSRDISYLIRMEPGVQTPDDTLKKRSGSCRDSAWLLCQLLRHAGLATRFVSGYIIQLKPDVKALNGPSGTDKDFTDLHAWCEVYLPGAGWIGLDPTSGLMASEGHIPLAATPDPQGAAPVTGALEACKSELIHEMTVTRVLETPRVTKPYTEDQWNDIVKLGSAIDQDLEKLDVRLTMGGEPTFVSIDDPDDEEWKTQALGEKKRLLSGQLIKRLRHQFSPGGLLHFGQGKWYPGEPLPRWSLDCYWRTDGAPIWKDDSLIADESKDYGIGPDEARAFMEKLTEVLGLNASWLLPAYEDVFYHLWKEKRLPLNVDPLKSNLSDKEERKRLARVFEQGLDAKAGWVLPMKYDETGWFSGPWYFRDGKLWLIPGDSPVGYRLPLDSLPWVSESDYPWIYPQDLMQELSRLPVETKSSKPKASEREEDDHEPEEQESAAWLPRTAMCAEARNGRLHIFMPPTSITERYLELITAIEETARVLGMPVVIEGETPPRDPRINVIKVTPDPGVIEVNMHPAHSWDEIVKNTKTLYEEARQTRLGTEKFMMDGRHTGTGGGNHIVMGAASPKDSPFLRRPDLLRSLLSYWHNHPSLSYLFSGLFIGPTSQAPRVDEARNDAIYELEIAFQQIPESGEVPPWLVDRLFRNLLADVTGNTHRTEFSIDKMFTPGGPGGRLGLLEMRSLEMPPHAEMSVAQHLLLRAAIARFWKDPFHPHKLVRWGTELHDRYMLPHFIWQDFEDVVQDMKHHGYPIDPAWFAPHFEFRFPHAGSIVQRGVELELRTALEPWHVLGEEATAGGTARYVDSSLERLQVKVRGLIDSRYVLTCNGRSLPLHPTGVVGEYVAGVRYRAWQPPECLHPTIKVHAPLVFDLVDTWNGQSAGGCTYHVVHPGGRSYETLPINGYEAESRRLARFEVIGLTPGKLKVSEPVINRDHPLTLDLRTQEGNL